MDKSKRVLIAMSGGVDSAVAAYLLKQQGYDCTGVTFRLFGSDGGTADADDARKVCDRLGIPHYILNAEEAFKEQVIRRFIEGYRQGQTPNPCIDCNRHIKFCKLWEKAGILGIKYVATGHYARIELNPACEGFVLKKAVDPEKDQSYVLYSLSQAQLSQTLFPLGGLHKREVRAIAEAQGFENARKRESQDICFVPDGDHAAFIERYSGEAAGPGDFVDESGRILGRHKGLTRYTVGQRKGLGIALQKPVFVLSKNIENNTVVLGENDALFTRTAYAGGFHWINPRFIDEPFRAKVKIRYRQTEQWALVTPVSSDTVEIYFDEPQRAIAPGQAAVAYDGEYVVGGGTIINRLDNGENDD